jgi:hypothetical protein
VLLIRCEPHIDPAYLLLELIDDAISAQAVKITHPVAEIALKEFKRVGLRFVLGRQNKEGLLGWPRDNSVKRTISLTSCLNRSARTSFKKFVSTSRSRNRTL